MITKGRKDEYIDCLEKKVMELNQRVIELDKMAKAFEKAWMDEEKETDYLIDQIENKDKIIKELEKCNNCLEKDNSCGFGCE